MHPDDAQHRPGYGQGAEAILRATVAVVADVGLRGLTFRAVARHAGVNNSLIAYHFGTRDNLVLEALRWAARRSTELSVAGDQPTTPETYRDELLRLVDDHPELQAFQYEMILEARRRPELIGPLRELYDLYVDSIVAGAAAMGRPRPRPAVARSMLASVDGLVLQYVTGAIGREEFAAALVAVWEPA